MSEEVVIALGVYFLVWLFFRVLNRSGSGQKMGPLEIRQTPYQLSEGGLQAVGLELKGLIPVTATTNISFVTSVLDATNADSQPDGAWQPVLSMHEKCQEPGTTAYQYFEDGARIEANFGFVDWVRVGVVVPFVLQPGYGGRRKLRLICRIVDMDALPAIEMGFCQEQKGLIAVRQVEYELNYPGKGFWEEAADRDEARSCTITLAMGVAMADGELHEREGEVIQRWVTRIIDSFEGEKRETLKRLYNDAMRDSYREAQAGTLTLSDVIGRMNEISEEPQKYEAINLCFDVMSADGTLADSEMLSIRRIAQALDIDYAEFEALKDAAVLGANSGDIKESSAWELLEIEQGWSNEEIKSHLRRQYAKWNSRLNSFPEGTERDRAQHMLQLIAETRAKYAE